MSTGAPDHDGSAPDRLAALHEELRIAEEELRAQQELIAELIRDRLDDQAPLSGLLAPVPVPVFDTDAAGTVLVANAAAGQLLGISRATLSGKPLQAYVASPHRSRVRSALTAVTTGAGTRHLRVDLLPRRTAPVPTDLVIVAAGRPGAGSPAVARPVAARWVVAPRVDRAPAPAAAVPAQPGSAANPYCPGEPGGVVEALAELAGLSMARSGLRPALLRVAALAVRAVAAAGAGSITVGPPAGPEQVVETDAVAQAAGGAQFQARQGPSWTAYTTREAVATDRIGADQRWPALHDAGLTGGALAVPVTDGGAVVGVLTLYGQAGLTGPDPAGRAAMFAAGAAAVLRERRVIAGLRAVERQLRDALDSRALIGQATGVLMARLGCGPEEAFADLVRQSQHTNVKLRVIAAGMVEQSAAALPD